MFKRWGNRLNNQIVCPKYLALCCTNTTRTQKTHHKMRLQANHLLREIIPAWIDFTVYLAAKTIYNYTILNAALSSSVHCDKYFNLIKFVLCIHNFFYVTWNINEIGWDESKGWKFNFLDTSKFFNDTIF